MGYVCLAPLNWEVRDIFSKEVTFRLRFRRWWGRVNHKIIWKKNIWSRVHSKCRELKVRVAWLLNEFIAHNSWGIVGVMEWSEDKWERKSQKGLQFMIRSVDFILGAMAAVGKPMEERGCYQSELTETKLKPCPEEDIKWESWAANKPLKLYIIDLLNAHMTIWFHPLSANYKTNCRCKLTKLCWIHLGRKSWKWRDNGLLKRAATCWDLERSYSSLKKPQSRLIFTGAFQPWHYWHL